MIVFVTGSTAGFGRAVAIRFAHDGARIIGTGRRGAGRWLRHSVSRYCLAHARCPVLAVPPSALMDEMTHGLRQMLGLAGRAVPPT